MAKYRVSVHKTGYGEKWLGRTVYGGIGTYDSAEVGSEFTKDEVEAIKQVFPVHQVKRLSVLTEEQRVAVRELFDEWSETSGSTYDADKDFLAKLEEL